GGLPGEVVAVDWPGHDLGDDRTASPRTYRVGAAGPRQARDPRQMPLAQRGAFCTPAGTDRDGRRGQRTRPKDEAKGRGQRTRPKDEAKGRGQRTRRVIQMGCEFERGGRTGANVVWEGP